MSRSAKSSPLASLQAAARELDAEPPRRGRPPRAGAAALRRLEFRVTPREANRIERLLRKRGGSLSGLVRELLAAEADRLGVRFLSGGGS